jgi:ketosteroid isomerase-like protein
MKSLFVAACLSLGACVAVAQTFPDKNQQSLIDAEFAFMMMAKDKNTREAFLYFLDDHAVTFDGTGSHQGKKIWEDRTPDNALLYWEPEFSDIAASGDFGFNTGPWEYKPDRATEKPVAFGHFVTIWKKQDNGAWKAALDIGITHPAPDRKEHVKTSAIKTIAQQQVLPFDERKNEIMLMEKNFIESLKTSNAYNKALSSEARLLRPGAVPYTSPGIVEKVLLTELKSPVTYHLIDGDVASSADLAYVYGTATIIPNDKTNSKQANYMRIWKREKGQGWRIVLDILSY